MTIEKLQNLLNEAVKSGTSKDTEVALSVFFGDKVCTAFLSDVKPGWWSEEWECVLYPNHGLEADLADKDSVIELSGMIF